LKGPCQTGDDIVVCRLRSFAAFPTIKAHARPTSQLSTLRLRAAHIPPCGSGSNFASIAATMSGDTEARPNDARPTFVSPRTLLEQARPILPPRTFTALDREQLDGLVGH